MSNVVPCPECGDEIDAVKEAIHDKCPECRTYFGDLLDEPQHNPEESGPYYEHE